MTKKKNIWHSEYGQHILAYNILVEATLGDDRGAAVVPTQRSGQIAVANDRPP